MNQYTIYCTKEQTERAYKLGAPIVKEYDIQHGVRTCRIIPEHEGSFYAHIPTAEQMCGWLRDKGLYVEVFKNGESVLDLSAVVNTEDDGEIDASIEPSDDYTIILLATIDAALDYLEKGE